MARAGKEMTRKAADALAGYDLLLSEVVRVIEEARRATARSVNAVMTATYWFVGRRIVEQEQAGEARAGYGEQLLKRLSGDLSKRFGRGFSERNLEQMRAFYLGWPIPQTASAKSLPPASGQRDHILQTVSAKSIDASATAIQPRFPLPWSAYVRLMVVDNPHARAFYETEALRGGWSIRQLDRQIDSLFYERTALSRDKAAMLTKGARVRPEDHVAPEEEIKEAGSLLFSVSNHHTGSCGEAPKIDGDQPGKYIGYFVSEHGEQAIYTYDFETGDATLRMGDSGWQATHPVVNGEVNGLLLTKAELTWLRACWTATGELARQRRSGEDAEHPRA